MHICYVTILCPAVWDVKTHTQASSGQLLQYEYAAAAAAATAKSLSVRLLVTPWTAAYQAPPSMGFSRQQYWSGVPLPSPYEYEYWSFLDVYYFPWGFSMFSKASH